MYYISFQLLKVLNKKKKTVHLRAYLSGIEGKKMHLYTTIFQPCQGEQLIVDYRFVFSRSYSVRTDYYFVFTRSYSVCTDYYFVFSKSYSVCSKSYSVCTNR